MADPTSAVLRKYGHGDFQEYGVQAATKLWQGQAIGINASDGMAEALGAGTVFVGFAESDVDNSAGADGALRVRVRARGRVQLPVTGADITKVGELVFASDSNTFTLTSAANRAQIGRIVQHISGTTVEVDYTMMDHVAP